VRNDHTHKGGVGWRLQAFWLWVIRGCGDVKTVCMVLVEIFIPPTGELDEWTKTLSAGKAIYVGEMQAPSPPL